MKSKVFLVLAQVFLSAFVLSAQEDGVYIEGTVGFEFDQEYVWLEADKITNYGPEGSSSGTLQLELWATEDAYDGAAIPGWELGSVELGILEGGFHWENVSEPAVIRDLPPAGEYFVTMFLSEWDGSEFGILEFLNFPESWAPFSDLLWRNHSKQGDWYHGWIGHITETEVYDWIYRTWAEWLYAVYDTENSGYFYSPYEGWIWMSESSSPYFYSLEDGSWYYYPDW